MESLLILQNAGKTLQNRVRVMREECNYVQLGRVLKNMLWRGINLHQWTERKNVLNSKHGWPFKNLWAPSKHSGESSLSPKEPSNSLTSISAYKQNTSLIFSVICNNCEMNCKLWKVKHDKKTAAEGKWPLASSTALRINNLSRTKQEKKIAFKLMGTNRLPTIFIIVVYMSTGIWRTHNMTSYQLA